MSITKRVFVSFDNYCPYQCKHCYTYGIERKEERTIDEIVNSISSEDFDVIYVSQKNDNFSDPQRGLELSRKLFKRYKSNVFIITRNVLNSDIISRLMKLKKEMEAANKRLYIAISLNAIESIGVCEDTDKVCSPESRIEFLKSLSEHGFMPILMLRPVFPDKIIPVAECLRIIEYTKDYISCVVSSGLGINDDVIDRLGIPADEFTYDNNQEYLQGAIDCEIKFVDVRDELKKIEEKCKSVNVSMFIHSMPALNYISQQYPL